MAEYEKGDLVEWKMQHSPDVWGIDAQVFSVYESLGEKFVCIKTASGHMTDLHISLIRPTKHAPDAAYALPCPECAEIGCHHRDCSFYSHAAPVMQAVGRSRKG